MPQRYTWKDVSFVIGLVTAFVWCGSQAERALTTTAGTSLAQYVAFCSGFAIQLALAIAAKRQTQENRVINQMLALFGVWTACSLALSLFVLLGTEYSWSRSDTIIASLSGVGLFIIVVTATATDRSFTDAAVKGWTNIVLKSIPQFLLAEKILNDNGAGGITQAAIVMGSVSILTRLLPFSAELLQKKGWNRDEGWLWVTDAVNLVSWLTVTVMWLQFK